MALRATYQNSDDANCTQLISLSPFPFFLCLSWFTLQADISPTLVRQLQQLQNFYFLRNKCRRKSLCLYPSPCVASISDCVKGQCQKEPSDLRNRLHAPNSFSVLSSCCSTGNKSFILIILSCSFETPFPLWSLGYIYSSSTVTVWQLLVLIVHTSSLGSLSIWGVQCFCIHSPSAVY